MTPTMTYFEQALYAPHLHFRQLRQIEPILCDGKVVVRHTHNAIESEILWEGRHYLLFLPFKDEALRHIEELEDIARERTIGPLIPHRIFYDEFIQFDSCGKEHYSDIILQEIPEGMMLKEAVNKFKTSDLREAILLMKNRLDNIGFCHNNLRTENIVICKSGIARPLRYWYAEWENFSDNNISVLLQFLSDYDCSDITDEKSSLLLNDDMATYSAPIAHEGIIRRCCGSRYGFVDSDGIPITRYEYSWASDFCEGRAIVKQNGKMGAIDSNGKKVINAIYESLEFDIQTGTFAAVGYGYRYLLDYDGNIICYTKIAETKESAEASQLF